MKTFHEISQRIENHSYDFISRVATKLQDGLCFCERWAGGRMLAYLR